MGSLSIFIDAGYLFKQGSGAVFSTKLGRHQVLLDAKQFMSDLGRWVCERYSSDELLRSYWYDGARQGIRTPDQLEVAALPFVKLRLGRINSSGQQKGVDTLMVRDLMVLSQERSIHRAVVLSGDEDLREGIEYAQDRGVRVAVLGIDVNGERNQSVELVREADESLLLPRELLVASMHQRERITPQPSENGTPAVAAAGPRPATGTSAAAAADAAAEFARVWIVKVTPDELAVTLDNRPRLPRTIDAPMLQHAVAKLGVPTIGEEARRAMRAAFWRELDTTTST